MFDDTYPNYSISDRLNGILSMVNIMDDLNIQMYTDLDVSYIKRTDVKFNHFMFTDRWSYRDRLIRLAIISLARFVHYSLVSITQLTKSCATGINKREVGDHPP